MLAFGERLGGACISGVFIALAGNLGAGKTTLSRGILRGRGHSGAVKSPTYTLVEPYTDLSPPVFHFDLYRLGDPEELMYMGIRDYFDGPAICLVEWPDQGRGFLPLPDISVSIETVGRGRELTLHAQSETGAAILKVVEIC